MTGPSFAVAALQTEWEQRVRREAGVGAAGVALVGGLLAVGLQGAVPLVASLPLVAALAGATGALATRRLRRRRALLAQPFDPAWEAALQGEVAFYRALEPAEQARFRREVQVFLGEKRIVGVGTTLDTTTRVLVAASAVIPIFGFPEWEWDAIEEVLVYPTDFDDPFTHGPDKAGGTLGMVGAGGVMRGVMILSQPALLDGFRNPADKRNVGLHEFAHLVDSADGRIDGLPAAGAAVGVVAPWIELVRREMEAIAQGESDLDPYGLTNPAEFFAVASEYFFERPGELARRRPELYSALAQVFGQDLRTRRAALARARRRPGRPGRNAPCPCGSGEKFKRCCLAR